MSCRPPLADESVRRLCAAMAVEVPPTMIARPLRESVVQFTRLTSQSVLRQVVTVPPEDQYLVVLALTDIPPHEVRYNGRQHFKPLQRKGTFSFRNCTTESVIDVQMSFDNLHAYIPLSAFPALAGEEVGFRIPSLDRDLVASFDDVVVQNLGRCLLPAFGSPEQANQLFVDHIAMALLAHLATTYGGSPSPALIRGGLAPRQVQRAKEILMSRLDGNISLEELARECGLSRSHFARAFRNSTGVPPHQWLMDQRLKRARELLMHSKLLLAEIADASGFADQSHFTRRFSAAEGAAPSVWRRQHSR